MHLSSTKQHILTSLSKTDFDNLMNTGDKASTQHKKTHWEKEKMYITSICSFSYNDMESINALNLDHSQLLLFGREIKI